MFNILSMTKNEDTINKLSQKAAQKWSSYYSRCPAPCCMGIEYVVLADNFTVSGIQPLAEGDLEWAGCVTVCGRLGREL